MKLENLHVSCGGRFYQTTGGDTVLASIAILRFLLNSRRKYYADNCKEIVPIGPIDLLSHKFI